MRWKKSKWDHEQVEFYMLYIVEPLWDDAYFMTLKVLKGRKTPEKPGDDVADGMIKYLKSTGTTVKRLC